MDRYLFSSASAVFMPAAQAEADRAANSVTHYGFYSTFRCAEGGITIAVTAKNAYRLYLDGEMLLHGPARTAHGYARVDEIPLEGLAPDVLHHIAVEVVVYGDTYNGYSNECTLEAGLLALEVMQNGRVLCATGCDDWQVCRLNARLPRTERVSHSRTCCEVFDLRAPQPDWQHGAHPDFVPAEPCADPVYLKRHSPLPLMEEHLIRKRIAFGSCRIDENIVLEPSFWNRELYTPKGYFDSLPVHAFDDVRRTVENDAGTVTVRNIAPGATKLSGDCEKYIAYDLGENHVGFFRIDVTVEEDCILDILHTEAIDHEANFVLAHNSVSRVYLPKGRTVFTSMEPGVARFVKLYLRTPGSVTVHKLSLIDYVTPDVQSSTFLCSDENITRLYRAANRTLVLNTLDIFMDCPDRERGGWLCDSLWTARAAFMMLSDATVERDFLENFLLTRNMCKGFFPEVYPGNSRSYATQVPITTWSFWLMCELCEYVSRTGDKALALEHTARVEEFVRGSSSFIGKTGLIENMPGSFVDWSFANTSEFQRDVSTSANALYAYTLLQLGALYGRADWTEQGKRMRGILRSALLSASGLPLHKMPSFPDGFTANADGTLTAGGLTSEAATYTALWSGLFTKEEAPVLFRTVRDTMGPAPRFPANPNIGGSGLFIGLCIRMDLLARFGAYDTLFADLNAIYQPQLREGPGTLWENCVIDTSSRCHGFNAHAGVHLLRDVLGISEPQRTETGRIRLTIAPHLCGLDWANGTMELPEGTLNVSWKFTGETFTLDVHTPCLDVFDLEIKLPKEARALEEKSVTIRIR